MIELGNADDRLAAAGEYVLGTLSAEDHDAVATRLSDDRALLADVYGWQDRLLSLTRHSPPVEPAPQLWQRIESELGGPAATPAPRAGAGIAAHVTRWWQRAGPWQGLSALGLAASLVLAVILVQGGRTVPGGEARYLAVLQSPQDQATGWIVEASAGRTLRLVPVGASAAPPAGRALQFWTKPQGAEAPTSLGLVQAGRPLELPVSRLPGLGAQQLFEITLEPEGGSPIGRPTGPILYVGRTLQL